MSAYISQIHTALPRILALFERESQSPTFGLGDRFYTSWCLIDFANGTFQGAAHGLAFLASKKLLPDWFTPEAVSERISEIFIGTKNLCRKNGSMEEAFPYEASFCVTALVACDLLESLFLLPPSPDKLAEHLEIVKPMILFLCREDETHGVISNHIATAVVALYLWHLHTGDPAAAERADFLLERIENHSSPEGWFSEYGGMDPGYQTLCLHYLTILDERMPELGLREKLIQAAEFLTHFVHPDGSFGGWYGSRCTRFYYPSGIAYLAQYSERLRVFSNAMTTSVENNACVTLDAMDEPNLIPMFNSYARAAGYSLKHDLKQETKEHYALPCSGAVQEYHFPDAQIYIAATDAHYTVVNYGKSGVVQSYSRDGKNRMLDVGVMFKSKSTWYGTQDMDEKAIVVQNSNGFVITTRANKLTRTNPTPFQFTILRLMNISVMRWRPVAELVKKILVRLLISRKAYFSERIIREIKLEGTLASVTSHWESSNSEKLPKLIKKKLFTAIHMASAGYWQRSDDDTKT